MIKRFFSVARLVLAWYLLFLILFVVADWVWSPLGNAVSIVGLVTIVFVVIRAYSHLGRVQLIDGKLSAAAALSNRQVRQVEVPFEADEAFDLLDTVIHELPGIDSIDAVRSQLQIRAGIRYHDPYGITVLGRYNPLGWVVSQHNRILASVVRGDGTSRLTLVCEPAFAPWSNWLQLDDGANLQNAEAITRAIALRLSQRRRSEQTAATQTATEKELAIARLSLLQAQVEPHFLYNTLASAQYLTRTDPASADAMLGHLIDYLRHSLPRTDRALSTLGEELERSRAYLEILKIRMGPRLNLQLDVPEDLLPTPLPPMMLQTLVENAIKHGLEPRPGDGTIWIFGRRNDSKVAVTVADDGLGFSGETDNGGIGLKNVRERLRLVYGSAASLILAANFPSGAAVTINVPATVNQDTPHA